MGLSNDLSCEAGSLSCCRPNPHGCFHSEVWGFISLRWSPGLRGLLRSPQFVPVYLCANVGPRGATHRSACPVLCHSESGPLGLSVCECGASGSAPAPFVPHSASLGPATATQVLSIPVPVSAPPTGLDECLFFISLVSDLLAVRFSVSSGCARRRSVSTYAAILVLPRKCIFIQHMNLSWE